MEDQGEGIGAARAAELFLETLFDTQDGLVELVQTVGLILCLLPGCDVGFHCNILRGCLLECLVFQFFEDIFVVVVVLCCDGVDGISILVEQFAHAVGLVQGVELFLGYLFELLNELDNVIVLILAHVIGVECDFLSCSTVLILFSRRALHTALLMALGAWGC